MKRVRKLFAVVLSVLFITLCYSNFAYAAEQNTPDIINEEDSLGPWLGYATECENEIDMPTNTDDSYQYFIFVDEGQKIDAYGNFTFSFSSSMESSSFKSKKTTLRVYATATSSNSNQTYYIGVKELGGNSVGYATYTANGVLGYADFPVNTYTTYVLYFSRPLLSNATITGSGYLDHIQ